MISRNKRPKTVAEYINAAPKETQKKLREMRACIHKTAPDAKENIKWGMPAYSYSRILVMFAGFKNHIGFYPTPSSVKTFAKELSKFHSAKGSVQFPLNKPLPLSLIKKMIVFRVKESRERDRKWRAK